LCLLGVSINLPKFQRAGIQ